MRKLKIALFLQFLPRIVLMFGFYGEKKIICAYFCLSAHLLLMQTILLLQKQRKQENVQH